ncbi:MAG: hypothetical protein RL528_770 [Bacteroidota bacterium]
MNILEKMKKEQDRWICLTLKINLLSFQVRYKNKQNAFYRSLSSGGNKLLGISNFIWFNNSFDEGFYRCSITIMGNIEYHFFFRLSELSNINSITRQLLIRTKKLGAFNVKIDDLNSMNYIDTKLLSSPSGMSAYQKVLKTYKGLKGFLNQNNLI